MKVGLAGDWHGVTVQAREGLAKLKRECPELEVVYQLGDFGIWQGTQGRQYLDIVQGCVRRHGLKLYVIPGNHENYDIIAEIPVNVDDGFQWIHRDIALAPRGHRWELGGRTFVALGGAPSVDFTSRVPNESWWEAEMITHEEAEAVAAAGHAEIMLAHDSPDGGTYAVQRIVADPLGVEFWGREGIAWARVGRRRMNAAFAGVAPKLFAHGHYHTADMRKDEERDCLFVSLNEGRFRHNVGVLDLDTLEVEMLP